jgi:hypothetical protein
VHPPPHGRLAVVTKRICLSISFTYQNGCFLFTCSLALRFPPCSPRGARRVTRGYAGAKSAASLSLADGARGAEGSGSDDSASNPAGASSSVCRDAYGSSNACRPTCHAPLSGHADGHTVGHVGGHVGEA